MHIIIIILMTLKKLFIRELLPDGTLAVLPTSPTQVIIREFL